MTRVVTGFPASLTLNKKYLVKDLAFSCRIEKRISEVLDYGLHMPDIVGDILEHVWVGPYNREKIAAVREIKMGRIGNVDMVVCNTSTLPVLDKFISVELQAIDITGSVSDAYTDHIGRGWRCRRFEDE
jgi:hypothetical protein